MRLNELQNVCFFVANELANFNECAPASPCALSLDRSDGAPSQLGVVILSQEGFKAAHDKLSPVASGDDAMAKGSQPVCFTERFFGSGFSKV